MSLPPLPPRPPEQPQAAKEQSGKVANIGESLFGPAPKNDPALPHLEAKISAAKLLKKLTDEGILDNQQIISLLGHTRHSIKLDELERVLVDNSMLSIVKLAEYRTAITGYPSFETAPTAQPLPVLDEGTVKKCAAIAVAAPNPTVAMILDDPVLIELLKEALQEESIDIWMITTPKFMELYRELYKGATEKSQPAVPDIFGIFDEMITRDSSDLHLGVGDQPRMRLDGALKPLETQLVDKQWMRQSIVSLLGQPGLEKVDTKFDADGGFRYGSEKFRINAGANSLGPTLAIRRLSSEIPTMDKLNLPSAIRNFTELERGLVLVTGPTGSGKSTTLAAVLSEIGVSQPRHMITLEDPIEYELPQRKGRVQQRELGSSFTSFSDGIRQSLRQDPDVILVGEARDMETIRAAVTAAETGALVFATLHTYDAASTIGRIINTFPEGEQAQIRAQLAYVLKGVVSQTLCQRTGGGRVAAFEILVGTNAVANNLRKIDGLNGLRQVIVSGAKDGMQTIESHLADLVRLGQITEDEARYKAREVGEFEQYLNAE